MNALTTVAHGRVSILSPEIVDTIIKHLSVGNYVRPSVEAAGIHYSTFRGWVAKGEEDKAAGRETPYSSLVERISRAEADAEASLVEGLRKAEDWRAQSFLLERRHRERWGKDSQESKASITVQIPTELVAVLADAMRVGRAHVIEGTSEPALAPAERIASKDAEFEDKLPRARSSD